MTFTLKIPLKIDDHSNKILGKLFNVSLQFYNECLAECRRRRDIYISHPSYLEARLAFKNKEKSKAKALYKKAEEESNFYILTGDLVATSYLKGR